MTNRGTIGQLLQHAAGELRGVSESPRLDAEVLLSEVLECDRTYLFAYGDKSVDTTAHDLYAHYVQRRKQGEPVAYIIGQREFWSLMLLVNDSTLIPRPDTEILVETALRYCLLENANVLDLGTGSGAIALALASEMPGWNIDAVDVHDSAVELAALNARKLGLLNVHVYLSDWLSAVNTSSTSPDRRFDLIVSNPPYIDAGDPHLQQGDLRFEPHTALVAGMGGYADLYSVALQARDYLHPGGLLLLEHGFSQGDELRTFLAQVGYSDIFTVKDYGGNERVTVARWVLSDAVGAGHE